MVFELLFQGFLAVYLLFGSTPLGYIILRSGWPNIRQLEIEYKTGWSIIIGMIFSVCVLGVSFAISFFGLAKISFLELVSACSIVFFSIAILLTAIKRKFMGSNRIVVSVPKRAVTANIIAKKAFDRVPEKSFVPKGHPKEHPKEHPNEQPKAQPTTASQPAVKPMVVPQTKGEGIGIMAQLNKKISIGNYDDTKSFPTHKENPAAREKEEAPEKNPVPGKRDYDQRKIDDIINILEKKEHEKRKMTMSDKELEEKVEGSKNYITENMKENIKQGDFGGPAKKTGEKDADEKLPKSARILKELLGDD